MISTVGPTFHTDLSRIRSFWKTLFKRGGISKLRRRVLISVDRNILKTELYENDGISISPEFSLNTKPK